MLQRAASNACSWWWASHIRTKQTKWLEQSVQDFEEKKDSMLKLIEEDGDSFAKRAEMYYKRRPELINSVEESYRAFRALADRYDILSKELQNANHTIATVFPEQVQFAMEEEDDIPTPKLPKSSPMPPPNAPKVPKAPLDDIKGFISNASKKLQVKKTPKSEKNHSKPVAKSGMAKDEALEELDKLQKEILTMQTVKEFVKSSYENSLAKYWEMENQITEMQEKACRLQDEFDIETVIEDNDACTLMAGAALKSCQETLAQLQEQQEKATREAREEFKKIESARQLLRSLRRQYMKGQVDETLDSAEESQSSSDLAVQGTKEIGKEPEKSLDLGSSLTVTELAEKIDELVNKVVSLESEVSSQTVLINTLRTETDDLHAQIQSLEDEKETLAEDTHNLSARIREMEEKLNKLQDLNKNVENHNSNLQTNFADARSSLDHLSEKLSTVKPDEEIEEPESSHSGTTDQKDVPILCDKEDVKEVDINVDRGSETGSASGSRLDTKAIPVPDQEEVNKPVKKTVTFLDPERKVCPPADQCDDVPVFPEAQEENTDEEGLNWQQMLLSGTEDREKILLKEYTAILRNYKDVKRKLSDTEKKERDSQFDMTLQMKELQKAIVKRDQEIQNLRHKINSLQGDETMQEEFNEPIANSEDEVKLVFIDKTMSVSAVEEKVRKDIDALVDGNLDFWLRFSTAFHQVQKFRSETQDLQDEISKLKDKKKNDGSVTPQLKSEARPIYKHLREIQTELTVWLEQSDNLKDELKQRYTSLCSIQEEITKALQEGGDEEEITLESYRAAKLQGEIMNMKQEHNKVKNELQVGLDHISGLQLEIEKTLSKLNEEFGISIDQPQLQHTMSRSKVPLHSFIFGTKAKKPRNSIFSFMHPNRKYQVVRAGVRHV